MIPLADQLAQFTGISEQGDEEPSKKKRLTIVDLMKGVEKYEKTRKIGDRVRQANSVKIFDRSVTGQVGVKTVAVATIAKDIGITPTPKDQHTQRMLFRGIDILKEKDQKHPMPVKVGDETRYAELIKKDGIMDCRCSCNDFIFTWAWTLKQHGNLSPQQLKKYVRKTPPPPEGRPKRNPDDIPGVCKHLLAGLKAMSNEGMIT